MLGSPIVAMQGEQAARVDVQAEILYEYEIQVSDLIPATSSTTPSNRAALLESGSKRAVLPGPGSAMSSWLRAVQLIQTQMSAGGIGSFKALTVSAPTGGITGMYCHFLAHK